MRIVKVVVDVLSDLVAEVGQRFRQFGWEGQEVVLRGESVSGGEGKEKSSVPSSLCVPRYQEYPSERAADDMSL